MDKTILIVEDDVIAQMTLSHMLSDMGYSKISCCSNESDLRRELQIDPNRSLILMDVFLKGVRQGITLAEEILEKYNIPVLFITASSDPQTVRQLATVAHSGILQKPYEYDLIQETITQVLNS